MNEAFGVRLRRLRKEKGFSIREMGRRTGISPQMLSQTERGERWSTKIPPFDDVEKLASVLDVDVLELAGIEATKEKRGTDITHTEEATTTRAQSRAKEAVQRAYDYLNELYEGMSLPNLRLEEVERSDDGRYWWVTYGFTAMEPEVQPGTTLVMTGLGGDTPTTRYVRDYKLITIDAQTGEPTSMKVRRL